jgi:protein phosphatase
MSQEQIDQLLTGAVKLANYTVYEQSVKVEDFAGMGTTLVAALFVDDVVYVVNVGDSRLYLISDNTITQITHDHSYVQHLIDNGSLTAEDARTHPYRNRITRAVGIKGDLETDIFSVDLASLDVCYLLLCSDGLCGQLVPEDIYSIISSDHDIDVVTDVESELQDKTERLIAAANDAGGPDNITAVLVRYVGDGEKRVEDDDDEE